MNLEQKAIARLGVVAVIVLVAASFGLMWAYWPPYSWFAEIQLAIMGRYFEDLTLLLTMVVLICGTICVLVACKILWKKIQGPRAPIAPTASTAPRTSTPAGPIVRATPAIQARNSAPGLAGLAGLPGWFNPRATVIILVGLGFAAFGGYNYYAAQHAGALTELDLSQLESGQAPTASYVHIRGIALDRGTVTFGTSGNMDAYTPLVSGQRKFPPTIFLKAHTDNAATGQIENLNAAPAHKADVFEGMLKNANDLPGAVRTEYQRINAIADTYYVLEVGQTPATQMGSGRIMAIIGGIIALLGIGVWVWHGFRGMQRVWLLGGVVTVGSLVLAATIALGFNAAQKPQPQDAPQAAPPVQAPPVADNTQNHQIPAPPVQPVSPPDEPTAETLKKIASTWQPNGSDAVELLGTMRGAANRAADGTVVLSPHQKLSTEESFSVPVAFRIIAQTHNADTRISFPSRQIIFNWEMNRDEFRIDGGPASGRHKPGAGRLPDDQWVGIELVVLRDQMIIYVDGQERYRTSADFSTINAPFGIWPQSGSSLKIMSITKVRP